jgi:hypothetical protein
MGFVYLGNGAFASIIHIVRVRHISNSENCEVILANNAMYLVPRTYLQRSEMTLSEVVARCAAVEAKRQKQAEAAPIHREREFPMPRKCSNGIAQPDYAAVNSIVDSIRAAGGRQSAVVQ